MQISVVLNGLRTAEEIAELARLAEDVGVRQLWLSAGARSKDHFLRLAVAATRTRSIWLGPIAVSPFEAHPARIALELLTLHEIAGGRTSLVLGGGGDFAATLGVVFEERVQAVAETIDIITALARGGEVSYRGQLFQVKGLFSPWRAIRLPPILVGANRPRMIQMAARKADGVMFTDMPLVHLPSVVGQVRAALTAAGRPGERFRISNWFVWNIQNARDEAVALASEQLGFRLYYIRDVAPALGLTEADMQELERRQPEMLRAIFEGREPWRPAKQLEDLLIRHLTITGGQEDLDASIAALHAFAERGVNEVALRLLGEPARGIRLLGERVIPVLGRVGDTD